MHTLLKHKTVLIMASLSVFFSFISFALVESHNTVEAMGLTPAVQSRKPDISASSKNVKINNNNNSNNNNINNNTSWQDLIPLRRERRVDCAVILDGDVRETLRASELSSSLKKREAALLPKDYAQASWNCSAFLSWRGYITSTLSQEEADFPIAFSILVYTDMEMAERLLRAIYRPQNYYCIHVDLRATEMYRAFSRIASCFPNVVMASTRVSVKWATFTVLEADLICMRTLWAFTSWRYLINLTGQEFPLKTNADLVRILKALNGSNDVHSTLRETYEEYHRYGYSQTPSWFRPIKGAVHVTLSRAFVDFLLHDPRAVSILDWVKISNGYQDEIFFSTLNHNPQLQAPGSYRGHPESVPLQKPFLSRYKVWYTEHDNFCFSNKWVRSICILTIGDLPLMLRSVQFFANKFHLQEDRLAISCLEEYLYNVTVQRYLRKEFLDVSFYKNLDSVKNQIF